MKTSTPTAFEAAAREALQHVNGHWKAAKDERDPAYALDLATCTKCKALVKRALKLSKASK